MIKSQAQYMNAPQGGSQNWVAKFLFVARYLPVLIEAYDKNKTCIFWNEAVATLSGYSPKEIEGRRDVVNLLYPYEHLRGLRTSPFSMWGYDFKPSEWTMISKDGRKHTISWFNLSKLYRPVEKWESWALGIDSTSRLETEAALTSKNLEFQEQSQRLSEIDSVLNVLFKAHQEERKTLIADFVCNQEKLIIPFLEKLKLTRLEPQQETLVDIVIENVHTTTNSLGGTLSHIRNQLTFIEFEVATMVARNKTTQEIADLMNLSPSTVAVHRNSIRRKLNLVKKGVSLSSYLYSSFNSSV